MTDRLTWVVQKNLFNERGYDTFISTLERMGIPHISIRVIPFDGGLEPEVTEPGPLVAYGSTTLSKVAVARGWDPGVFFDEVNFTAEAWDANWPGHTLNGDGVVVPFSEVRVPPGEYRFIRPHDDLKTFSGHVVYHDAFEEWRERILGLEACTLRADHKCVVAPVKRIAREYRFFVVGGKVVTGCTYKVGELVLHHEPRVEDDVWAYAQARVDEWCPAVGFVLDIAMSEGVLKVIEVNCLNSSGFYACDASKIVQAVTGYYERNRDEQA